MQKKFSMEYKSMVATELKGLKLRKGNVDLK